MNVYKWIGGIFVVGLEAVSAALLGGCATTGSAHDAAVGPALRESRGVLLRTVGAEMRSNRYAIYVPYDIDLTRPSPAVVFLNGRGECGTDGTRQLAVGLLPAALSKPEVWKNVIMIMPQKPGIDDTWVQHDDLVMACLAAASREFRLDPARIYLTGLSQGGAGTWSIGAKHPELFAAIAPVCGFAHQSSSGSSKFGDEAMRREIAESLAKVNMPIWTFHGELDGAVPITETRTLVEAVKVAGGSAKASYYADLNHNCWDKAYRDEPLEAWFLSHRKGA